MDNLVPIAFEAHNDKLATGLEGRLKIKRAAMEALVATGSVTRIN